MSSYYTSSVKQSPHVSSPPPASQYDQLEDSLALHPPPPKPIAKQPPVPKKKKKHTLPANPFVKPKDSSTSAASSSSWAQGVSSLPSVIPLKGPSSNSRAVNKPSPPPPTSPAPPSSRKPEHVSPKLEKFRFHPTSDSSHSPAASKTSKGLRCDGRDGLSGTARRVEEEVKHPEPSTKKQRKKKETRKKQTVSVEQQVEETTGKVGREKENVGKRVGKRTRSSEMDHDGKNGLEGGTKVKRAKVTPQLEWVHPELDEDGNEIRVDTTAPPRLSATRGAPSIKYGKRATTNRHLPNQPPEAAASPPTSSATSTSSGIPSRPPRDLSPELCAPPESSNSSSIGVDAEAGNFGKDDVDKLQEEMEDDETAEAEQMDLDDDETGLSRASISLERDDLGFVGHQQSEDRLYGNVSEEEQRDDSPFASGAVAISQLELQVLTGGIDLDEGFESQVKKQEGNPELPDRSQKSLGKESACSALPGADRSPSPLVSRANSSELHHILQDTTDFGGVDDVVQSSPVEHRQEVGSSPTMSEAHEGDEGVVSVKGPEASVQPSLRLANQQSSKRNLTQQLFGSTSSDLPPPSGTATFARAPLAPSASKAKPPQTRSWIPPPSPPRTPYKATLVSLTPAGLSSALSTFLESHETALQSPQAERARLSRALHERDLLIGSYRESIGRLKEEVEGKRGLERRVGELERQVGVYRETRRGLVREVEEWKERAERAEERLRVVERWEEE